MAEELLSPPCIDLANEYIRILFGNLGIKDLRMTSTYFIFYFSYVILIGIHRYLGELKRLGTDIAVCTTVIRKHLSGFTQQAFRSPRWSLNDFALIGYC